MSASVRLKLREMILSGELSPGEPITESGLAERFGLSRTPIRSALPALAAEGILVPRGKRGFSVKAFTVEESKSALEIRSALEGIAAKTLAENGASAEVLVELDQCLELGDGLFEKRHLIYEDEEAYGEMNARFHRVIVENCGSALLLSMINRLNMVPFIAPSAIVFKEVGLENAYNQLFRSHGQHHAITEAIRLGESARANSLFQEHGLAQRESIFSRIAEQQARQA